MHLHKRFIFKWILKEECVRTSATLKLTNDISEGILGSCHGLFYCTISALSWEEQVKLLTLKSRYLSDYEPHMLPLRQLDQSATYISASDMLQSYAHIICVQWQADRGRCSAEAGVSASTTATLASSQPTSPLHSDIDISEICDKSHQLAYPHLWL
jgi:hypothetical protein